MINSDSNIPQNKLNNETTTTGKSKITAVEKIIIGILLVVLILVTVAIVKKMIEVPVSHDSLIANGLRRDLTFVPFFGFKSVVYSIGADGKKFSSELLENLGMEPEWSPDGKWIVYKDWQRDSDGFSTSEIYIQEANGSQKILVPISGGGYAPTWSPDGKQIAVRGYTPLGAGIYIINVECLLHGESCIPDPRFLVEEPA